MNFNRNADDILGLIEKKNNIVIDEILFDYFDVIINDYFSYLDDDQKLFEISI